MCINTVGYTDCNFVLCTRKLHRADLHFSYRTWTAINRKPEMNNQFRKIKGFTIRSEKLVGNKGKYLQSMN